MENIVARHKKRIRKNLIGGTILIVLTIWLIPGLFFRALSYLPQKADGIVNWLFKVSYEVSPSITTIEELIKSFSNQGASVLLTWGNFLSLGIVLTFTIGCSMITKASKDHDQLLKAKRDNYFDDLKNSL